MFFSVNFSPVATSKIVQRTAIFLNSRRRRKCKHMQLCGVLWVVSLALRIFVLNECVNILNLLLNIALLKTIKFSEHYFSVLLLCRRFFFSLSPSAINDCGNTKATAKSLFHTEYIITCSGIRNRSACYHTNEMCTTLKIVMNVLLACAVEHRTEETHEKKSNTHINFTKRSGTMKTSTENYKVKETIWCAYILTHLKRVSNQNSL